MTSELYDVVVSGHVRPGFDKQAVLKVLGEALNKPGEQIIRLLNGEEHAVRRRVTQQKAKAYSQYFYHLGLEVKLAKVQVAAPASTSDSKPDQASPMPNTVTSQQRANTNIQDTKADVRRAPAVAASKAQSAQVIAPAAQVKAQAARVKAQSARVKTQPARVKVQTARVAKGAEETEVESKPEPQKTATNKSEGEQKQEANVLDGVFKDITVRQVVPLSAKLKVAATFFPVGLIAGGYILFPVVLGACLIAHMLFNASNLAQFPQVWSWASYLLPIIFGGPFLIFLLKPILAKKHVQQHAIEITEHDEANLWRTVKTLAARLRVPEPVCIKLEVGHSQGVTPRGSALTSCFKEPSLVLGVSDLRVLPEKALLGHLAQQFGYCHSAWMMKIHLFVRWLDVAIKGYLAGDDSWDEKIKQKIEALEGGSLQKVALLELKRNFDFQRTIIGKFEPLLKRKVRALDNCYKANGDLHAMAIVGTAAAIDLVKREASLNKALKAAIRLNAQDRENFVLAENIPVLVAWLAKSEKLVNRYLRREEQGQDKAIKRRIAKLEKYEQEGCAERLLCTSDVFRDAELLEEQLTLAYYKTQYEFPLVHSLADAESIIHMLTNQASEEKTSAAYFSNWKYQIGQWVLPELNNVPEKSERACVKALNSVIERIRSITPDRNKLCDDVKFHATEVCHLNVARIAESFGDVYHVKGVSNAQNSVSEALSTKTKKLEKSLENLTAFEEVMGLRVVLGIRLAQIKKHPEAFELYQYLQRFADCQKLLMEFERHLQAINNLREQLNSKQGKRYQLWIVKSERCLEDLIHATIKHGKHIPYFWGQKHEFLAEYIKSSLAKIPADSPQNKQRRALIVHRIICESNLQISRRIGTVLGKLEKVAGVYPLKIDFKIKRANKQASTSTS